MNLTDNSNVYGYARVSSKDQNLDRQMEALKNYGINDRDIISDKQSGKDDNLFFLIASIWLNTLFALFSFVIINLL